MAAPFKIPLITDVSQLLKGTQQAEDAIEKVADTLDELGRGSADAADKVERSFKDAFDDVQDRSKQAGKKIGDDVHDGAKKAAGGIGAMKDEAKQSVRETAASFSDITDGLDLVQEIAANAFVGFGPAGMAAGALAAIGIGLIKTSLDDAKTKADDFVEMTHTMAQGLRETGGVAGILADSMEDIVDTKEWYEFWQKLPIDRLTLMSQQMKELGLNSDDVFRAMSGDMEAYDRVAQQAIRNTSEANLEATTTFLNGIRQQGEAINNAKQWNADYADSAVAAQAKVEEAQKHAADVSKDWAESLSDHLNVAAEGLDGFVKDGKLNLKEWAAEVKRRTKEVSTIEDFKVDVFPKLSPEAQEEFAKLPAETQAQIAKAYKDGSKGDKNTIEATLEAQVKVNPKVDKTSIDPVAIPTKVDTSAAAQQTQQAATAAQTEANKSGNEIEFKTRIDRDGLQRQVNRAAASLTPPTVYVNVKARKEVP